MVCKPGAETHRQKTQINQKLGALANAEGGGQMDANRRGAAQEKDKGGLASEVDELGRRNSKKREKRTARVDIDISLGGDRGGRLSKMGASWLVRERRNGRGDDLVERQVAGLLGVKPPTG